MTDHEPLIGRISESEMPSTFHYRRLQAYERTVVLRGFLRNESESRKLVSGLVFVEPRIELESGKRPYV